MEVMLEVWSIPHRVEQTLLELMDIGDLSNCNLNELLINLYIFFLKQLFSFTWNLLVLLLSELSFELVK